MSTKLYRNAKAILFDLDGTLVRTFIDFPSLRNDVTIYVQKSLSMTALPTSDVIEMRNLLPIEHQKHCDIIIEKHEELGCSTPSLIEGASYLIEELKRRGKLVGIITRNCRRIAQSMLEANNLKYDLLIAREDCEKPKPYPDPLMKASSYFGISANECVMIGDSWHDTAAGRAFGCFTIGIQWEYEKDAAERFALHPPDILVTSLQEVSTHLLMLQEEEEEEAQQQVD